jgi:hypothetical protein
VTTTNAHGRKGVTAVHALYTPTVTTASRSVARSSTSQNASVNASASGVSSLLRTAPHLVATLARKRSTTEISSRGRARPRIPVTRGGPKGRFRQRLPLRRRLDKPPTGPHVPRPTEPKLAFLWEPFWVPRGSRLLTGLSRSDKGQGPGAPSSNADENSGSGPNLTEVLNQIRAPQHSPSWEGPFKVTGILRPEGNCLATAEGVPPPVLEHLCKFYL